MGQYGSYSSQSVRMLGGYWSAAYSPACTNMSSAVNSLFDVHDAVGFAKALSFVTSVAHCFNEAVAVTVVKYMAVQMLKDGVVGVGTAGAGVGVATGAAAPGGTVPEPLL